MSGKGGEYAANQAPGHPGGGLPGRWFLVVEGLKNTIFSQVIYNSRGLREINALWRRYGVFGRFRGSI